MPADGPLTRKDLARSLTGAVVNEPLGVVAAANQIEAEKIVRHIEKEIVDALVSGRDVLLSGLFKLEVNDRPSRAARNPRTGESIQIAAKRVVKLKVLSQLQRDLNPG